ncbi:MAG: hypothetical protein ACAH88_20205, partial [Roseimicrobium sp.]
VAKMNPQKVQWQAEKENLQNRMAELEQKKQLIQLIDGQKLPPIPGWVLTYIANITPDELLLTELQVKRMDDLSEAADAALTRRGGKEAKVDLKGIPEAPRGGLWSVRLVGDGKAMAPVGETAAPNIFEVFERWTNQLTTGPLHLKITKKTLPTPQTGKSAAWLMTGGQQGIARRPPFLIEGVIR